LRQPNLNRTSEFECQDISVKQSSLLTLRRQPATSSLFPYTTLFRSQLPADPHHRRGVAVVHLEAGREGAHPVGEELHRRVPAGRSEEHTSELQSRENLVCRLLLEKKKRREILLALDR